MKFVLEPELFVPQNSISLHALAWLSATRRHRLEIADDQHPNFVSWMAALAPLDRAQWESQIAQGYVLETREPAYVVLRIATVESSNWKTKPAVCTLADALKHFTDPFRILLENSMNDRSFLLRLAGDRDRKILLELESENVITFEHGGGISFMPAIISKAAMEPWRIDRYWVLFDSDGLDPNQPSNQSQHLAHECQRIGMAFHQLRRRNIENYLTRNALSGWAFKSPRTSKQRRRILEAYYAMSSVQREHYYLKTGFRKEHSASLYAGLTPYAEATLHEGFGSTILALFHGEDVKEGHLRKEGMLAEMAPVVGRLLAMIR